MNIEDIKQFTKLIKGRNASQNLIGEHLRESIFSKNGFGCYSTFDVQSTFHQVSLEEMREKMPTIIEAIKEEGWFYENDSWSSTPQCYLSLDENIAMVYAWTNDGYLSFSWKEDNKEMVVFNTDCKKNRWLSYK